MDEIGRAEQRLVNEFVEIMRRYQYLVGMLPLHSVPDTVVKELHEVRKQVQVILNRY